MTPFLLATPSPTLTAYQLPMASAGPSLTNNVDTSTITNEQQQLSPNSATSSNGEERSTPGGTTTTVLTPDGQQMMIQTTNGTGTNVNPQLVQIAQPTQQLYMPMQAAVQQPRVVALRTAQGNRPPPPHHSVLLYSRRLGGIQHFIEYPTAQLLQAQQQQQQAQFIQHNGQLVQVIRPSMGYSSNALIQQFQQQQQQQQVLAAQYQAQQIAAMQQSGGASSGAIFLQNSAGQIVLAQANPQAMRVVQIPYVPN